MKSVVKTAKSVDEAVHLALVELQRELDEVDIEILEESKAGFLGFGSRNAVVRVTLREETPKEMTKSEPEEAVSAPTSEPSDFTSKSVVSTAEEAAEGKDDVEKELTLKEEAAGITSSEEEADRTDMSEAEACSEAFDTPTSETESGNAQEERVEEFAADWLLSILEQMHIDAQVSGDRNENTLFLEISDLSDEDTGIVIGRRAETLNALQYLLAIAINRHCEEHLRVLIDVGGYRGRRKASIETMARRTAEKVQRFRRSIALEPMNAYERRIVHFALQDMPNVETVSEGRDPYRKVVIRYTK
uniref:RNA-binding cell elongation regulator Jag/EloR n=1 Tax=Ndongobacter massiliensis TaxID=1871025 RepID=UPI00093094DC|nr:RNA-binding cell elongation regulator Jag/EloR [Ndongobacter massiliensis]